MVRWRREYPEEFWNNAHTQKWTNCFFCNELQHHVPLCSESGSVEFVTKVQLACGAADGRIAIWREEQPDQSATQKRTSFRNTSNRALDLYITLYNDLW